MKVLITPSKEMKKRQKNKINEKILFKEEYKYIVENLQKYDVDDLIKLYKVKEVVAKENFVNWEVINKADKCAAIDLFNGLMYRNIEHESFLEKEIDILNSNIRIISPLYGVLKPLDGINEHRLDFSKNFKLSNEEKIVDFWKDKISEYLLEEDEVFINLLSEEFTKVLDNEILEKSIYVKFKELKAGELKVHSTISKKARGSFVKYIVKNNITDIKKLRKFDHNGYLFRPDESKENELVFIREV